MSNVQASVRRAGMRLNLNATLTATAVGAITAAAGWGCYTLVERSLTLHLSDSIGPALFGGLFVLVSATSLARRWTAPLAAAVAIDAAAGLRERLSTALQLERSPDAFARAAREDAERKAAGLPVGRYLPVRAPAFWPWSAATVAAALLLYAFMPQLNLLARAQAATQSDEQAALAVVQAEDIKAVVNEQMSRTRDLMKENAALSDLAKELEPIEMPDKATITPDDVRREAVKRIDSVKERIEAEQSSEKANAFKELQRQLAKLDPEKGQDPASKLSQALAKGDMQAAKKALEELQKEVKESAEKLGDEQKSAQAQQQLEQMAKQMEQLAQKMEALSKDNAALQKELENKGGLTKEQAEELLKKLAQMDPKQLEQQLQQAMKEAGVNQQQLQQLAQKVQQKMQAQQQAQNMQQAMQQAAQCMQACAQKGDASGMEGAAQAMGQAMAQLSEWEMTEQAMADMQAAMDKLQQMRAGMCQNPGDKIGDQGPGGGLGYGAKVGREAKAHQYEAQRARLQLRGGEIIGQSLVDGPQIRGEATAEAREAVASAVRDAQDAIERQDVPAQYQRPVASYFEKMAGLGRSQPADKKQPAGDKQASGESKDGGDKPKP